MKHLSILDKITPASIGRFWSHVEITEDCWVWTGCLISNGYGHFKVQGKSLAAHRFSFTAEFGAIEDEMVIDHLCRNRRCVRPDHLEMVTQKENVLRGDRVVRKTECSRGHALMGDNLMPMRNGYFRCRECQRLAKKASYRKRVTQGI